MAPIKGRVRLQLLQELDMSAIKVARPWRQAAPIPARSSAC